MNATQGRIVVCFPFIGDIIGGSHLSALGLIRHLDLSKFEPLIVLHRPDGPLADLLRRERVPFEQAPVADHLGPGMSQKSRFALAHVAQTLPRLVRFLRSRQVSIVHTNDGRTHVTWGIAARLAGAKLLWHQRGDPGSLGLRHVAPWIANRLVAVSDFAAPRRGVFSAARKCSVVHSPFNVATTAEVDRSTCRARLVAELGCRSETLLLGYVGTLVDRKRPLLFVEVVAALGRLAPELEIVGLLFGDALNDLDKAVVSRAASLGVSDRIRLMGFRYPGEPWLAALDLLLVTAVDEPFGRTLIEAMLLGTPVIAAASGGNIEAIRDGETGILVQPDDAEAFASAALALSRDPPRRAALVAAAQRDARARFGVKQHVRAITHIYEGLLWGNKARDRTRRGLA